MRSSTLSALGSSTAGAAGPARPGQRLLFRQAAPLGKPALIWAEENGLQRLRPEPAACLATPDGVGAFVIGRNGRATKTDADASFISWPGCKSHDGGC